MSILFSISSFALVIVVGAKDNTLAWLIPYALSVSPRENRRMLSLQALPKRWLTLRSMTHHCFLSGFQCDLRERRFDGKSPWSSRNNERECSVWKEKFRLLLLDVPSWKNMIFIVELLNYLLQIYIFFTPLYACLPLQRIASFTLINIVENTRIIEIFFAQYHCPYCRTDRYGLALRCGWCY